MALLHQATLRPSKLELLAAFMGSGALTQLGAYRFDDPAGEVGIETHIVEGSGGAIYHLPLTYRSEPLASADEWVIGTMEHSVLGQRWVYNGCGDPVYAAALVNAILAGGTQAEQYFETEDGRTHREPTATVQGSGAPGTHVPAVSGIHSESFDTATVIDTGAVQVVVRHDLSAPEPESMTHHLSGEWNGTNAAVVLAFVP